MRSWAERETFTPEELALWKQAEALVARANERPFLGAGDEIRCHELARAVGKLLNLRHVDGSYGPGIEHTWLLVGDWQSFEGRKILDVYVPGGMPQVQLVAYGDPSLRHWRDVYRQGVEYARTDIRFDVIEKLLGQMRGAS